MKKSIAFKLLCIAIMSVILLTVPLTVAAEENTVTPLVHTPCSGGNGICQMVSKGFAHIYDINTRRQLYTFWACWQCKNCLTAMATEGEPPLNLSIGHYVSVGHYEELNTMHNNLYVNPNNIGYTTATSLEGYRFMYQT